MSHIRSVVEDDLPEILHLTSIALRECVAENDENYTFLMSEIEPDYDWWICNKEKAVFLVYESDGEILGTIMVREYWNLCDCFVLPKVHKNGIGKQLVLQAIDECRGKSPKGKMSLNSSNHYLIPIEIIYILQPSPTSVSTPKATYKAPGDPPCTKPVASFLSCSTFCCRR